MEQRKVSRWVNSVILGAGLDFRFSPNSDQIAAPMSLKRRANGDIDQPIRSPRG